MTSSSILPTRYHQRSPPLGRKGWSFSWLWLALCLLLIAFSIHYWSDDGKGVNSLLRMASKGSKGELDADNRPLFIVGTHHKTGTALMALVLREAYAVHKRLTGHSTGIQMGYFGNPEGGSNAIKPPPFAFYFCDTLYTDTWNKTDINTTDHLPKLVDSNQFFYGDFYFAHLVRDPLELVISAYLYHYGGPPDWQEPWLYEQHPVSNYQTVVEGSSCNYAKNETMSWYDVLHCLNEEEGLLAEAVFQTYFGALPSMVGAVKHLYHRPGVKVLKLDLAEFQNDFDSSVRKMFTFFGMSEPEVDKIVRGASQYDLKRQTYAERQQNQHVTTGKFDKSKLRAIMSTYRDPVFLEARKVLGYPKQVEVSSRSGSSSDLPPAVRRNRERRQMREKEEGGR